ncbi:hypothetical protein VVAX_04346 [Variovorax paradoxus]|uniref:Uncharacterized protein n=2 Tax=Variovorax paradoxus TaxID=34073 RepID=A0A679JFM0_VARPD|nr:hypothetical protein VVAX_04346 [Variovorax paradoxus]
MPHIPVYVVDSVTVDSSGNKTANVLRIVRSDLPTGLVPVGALTLAAPDEDTAALLVPGAKLCIEFTVFETVPQRVDHYEVFGEQVR